MQDHPPRFTEGVAISLILLGYACDHPQTHIPPTFPFTPTRGISRVWSTTSKHRYSRWCTVKHRPTTTVGHSGGRHSMAAAWESPLTYYLHAPLLSRPRRCTRCPRSAGCARPPATRASVVCHSLFVFVHTYDDTSKIIEHLAACKRAMLMNILLRTPVFLRYNENECSKRDLLLFPSVHLPSASRSYGVRYVCALLFSLRPLTRVQSQHVCVRAQCRASAAQRARSARGHSI